MATATSDESIDADAAAIENRAVIVLYDGTCGLCDRMLRFATKRVRPGKVEFLTLQSEQGRQLQMRHGLDPQRLDSMILIENGRAFTRGDASLRLLKFLHQPWPILSLLLIVPRFLRNWVYDWIARNRIRWFGTCELPSAEK